MPETLVRNLRRWAALKPDRRAYTFLADGEEEQGSLTWGELDARARAIAASLQERAAPGDRALLLCPPGLDFVAAFFGCLYAGVVAVPAYPPRSARALPRLHILLEDSRPAVALAPAASGARIRSWLARHPELPPLPWLAVDEVPAERAGAWREFLVQGDDLAFLQYTSGSTAAPRGVMVSRANLDHNQEVIRQACEHTSDSVLVSWLPLYHDLGLIGILLQAAWVGAPCVLMAPVAFLQSPVRWLRAVSRYRATTSGGPNFAYDLCVRKIPAAEREGLDLSSWRVAFNGAEPVRAGTLARFAEAFAPSGFRREALYPCYGLAEATLMVSGNRPGEGPALRGAAVGCGRVLPGLDAVIADPATATACAPGKVGEIWIAGGSVARGYWNRPEENAGTFGASLTDGRGPYLRTGDLGFLDGGQLFIAGRIKDLVILRGRNHHPQDLELTAERSHPALQPGGGAAFAVEAGGEERLVLVHEIERHGAAGQERIEEIAAAVRTAVAAEHEAVVFQVVLVPPGGVPRTTSGKVQRRACRELYLSDGLPVLGRSALGPETAEPASLAAGALREALAATPEAEREPLLESWLRQAFARIARIDPQGIDVGRPLGRYGLDSLVAVELKNAVEAELGAELSMAALLEGLTLSEAARQILSGAPPGDAQEAPAPSAPALHPLSWNQRSLWVQHRLAPESAAYHIAAAARVEGGADPELLRRALQTLVDRHAILRTTYVDGPDGPLQRIAPHQEVAFLYEGASVWSDEDLAERLREEAFRPFDLERGPVFRAGLFSRGSEAFLVLAVHHIAADLWSLAVLARELGIACGGDAERLPEAEGDYLGFVQWQEQRLAGPRGERLWEHWRERLAGAPPLDLPTDSPRPPAQGFRGVTRTLRLSSTELAAVQALAQERESTLFMALLAGFEAVLGRWSGQEDFLVGAPTTGRASARWAEVAGYFVDLVALRAGLAGDPTGEALLARVRCEALDAFEHQDFPFALLAERLQPERLSGRPPLVQAVLSLEKAPAPELAGLAAFALGEPGARLSLGALRLHSVELPSPGAQRDLTLLAAELDGGLALALQADADLFDAATAERLLGHLANLLRGLAAAPERRVAEIEILSAAERGQLLHDWSGAAPAYPREEPIHRLFEETARRMPHRTAVVCGDLELNWAELSARANQLARHLRSLGVAPETLVGVALERSPELVVSCLAILQAGGAYVPLDPGYPRERLETLLAEVSLPLILTEERLLDRLPPGGAARLCLDREQEAIARHAVDPLDIPVSTRQLAYVMFTSGSTGRPKAVGVEHRSVVRLVRGADWADLGPEQVFLQLAPVSFDAATLEIWGPLLNGGRLVLFPGGAPSLGELAEALERHRVTTLWLTAGLFHQMVEARIESLAGLSQLLAGGDVLSPAHVERALAGLPGCRLINGYGPTENTTFTCCYTIRGPVAAGGTVPIGRPVANTRVYVLDRELLPAPVGVPGELHAGGDGLARGYLGRPDLTAERFIPDPFAAEPGGRLYRTGDRVRWRADGTIDFLGRLDQQVKIRGFRVEPGEVEAALRSHPDILDCAVVARAAPHEGERRLVAWVVLQPECGIQDPGPALRAFLQSRLPEPIVPSAFVVLSKLPLGPNGKVDRRALPDPEPSSGGEISLAATRTPTEEILAGLWAELLGRESVASDDRFFDLGGHSLLAARLLSRLREPFGVELPLKILFESPSLGAFAAAVDRAHQEAGGLAALPPVRPVPRDGEIPLSFAQERLWFLERLTPGTAVYNIPAGLRLRGSLDEEALQSARDGIIRRHEALRTVFAERGGLPTQTVLPAAGWPLARVDLAGLPAEAALEAALAEARRPFEIAEGPALARATLLRLAPDDHLLVTVFHHIIADGASLDVFHRELEALYAGSSLPELPVQPADHAVWEREALTGERLAAELSWWRERLAGAPAALELPTDRLRPPVQRHRGAAEPWGLKPEPVRELRALARREGATLFITLLAGLATLLSRYARQDDLVIGAPVAHRSPETEGLIGLFVSTLPLRIGLHGEPSFRGLLARAREAVLGAHAHQMVPFERLVREIQPRRDLSRSPVFQVMLAVQDGARALPRLRGLEAELVPLHSGAARFDLTLALDAREGGLAGGLELDADLFDAATGRRMLAHLRNLLAAAVADPGAPVLDLPLLDAAESRQILVEWSATAPAEEPGIGLHELFRAQAARTPEAVALIGRGERLTYRELAARVDRLARRLQGIEPEALIGILSSRTPNMVAGMLGVLAAGGAYLPLDLAYPAERLAFLLADSRARVILSDAHGAAALPSSWDGTVILLDAPGDEPLPSPAVAKPAAGQLAYVIYTSGSTGVPKGVGISHGSAAARVAWGAAAYGPERLRGVLAATSICFDLSVFEIFVPLATGGTVVLAADALELADLPAASEVTLVNTVPSALAALLRSGGLPSSVRTINLAGEPLRRELVSRAYGQPGVEEVWNLYGPSEDTTYSTGVLVPRDGGEPTIGQPLPGDTLYVLDPHLRPVPVGVPGELWLGGAGLARGYLGRPELTADRFRPDPFGGAPGGRLYRTGDLGRFRTDGEIELLGRLDHQVKVRGFRIEPGEIEAVLARHPAVTEAVVAARGAGERAHLVVWVEAAGAGAQELRAWLGERLPTHLIPGVWVLLDRLPRTPNGKIDRAALPAPDAVEGDQEAVLPRTQAEELIAGIWADLLGTGRIGLHDDFFALGGHSLLAVQVATRLRETLGVELPLRALFETPTVAGLAARLADPAGAPPPLTPGPRSGALPLSFAQERLWFLDKLSPGSAEYNVPAAFYFEGPLSAMALAGALDGIVRRHEILRTVFPDTQDGPVQAVLPPGAVPLPVLDLSALPELARSTEAARQADAEARRPFDLARGPLLRALLMRLALERHDLVLNVHHIVYDGWSAGVLTRELAALYDASPQLPGLPVQYSDFAAWQRRWIEAGGIHDQLEHWRGQLGGAIRPLDLPADRSRPAVRSSRGGLERFELGAELDAGVGAIARQASATRFMVLLTAFQTLLHRSTGQDAVRVGTPVANRGRREVENLIGLFVNTLVLRADFGAAPSFTGLLHQVRETALGAFSHQELPFEKLVEALAPERDLSRNPLFQVLFLLAEPQPVREIAPGLALRIEEIHNGAAKVDLKLVLEPGGFLRGAFEFSADLFEPGTVRRMAGHLRALLQGIVVAPQTRVDELPLLDAAERRQLVIAGPPATASSERTVYARFAAWVERTPDAPSVVFEDEQLSYRELDRRARALARRLRALGAGPEVPVAVCLERSAAMIAAILGVLETGGAYVPLDPDSPAERLAFVLADSGAAALVTEERLLGLLPESGLPIVSMDRLPAEVEGDDRGRAAGPEHLAYVIYTSGSTGSPKGVAVEHRQLASYLDGVLERIALPEGASYATVSTLAADLGNTMVFAALTTGGALHVLSRERVSDAERMADHFDRHPVDCLKIVPSHLAALLTAPRPERLLPRRLLMLGGEASSWDLADQLRGLAPGVRLVNHYGPTETTVGVLTCEVAAGQESRLAATLPIGRPLAGVRAWVAGPLFSEVPSGAPGELLIGGATVTRGYLGRPDLTAERFVPDSFGKGGERLYRTGDRVRLLPGGEIEFLGRIDQQVKIRGFRVEPAEVERLLESHPEVARAAVLARPVAGELRLAAWVAPRGAARADLPAALRPWLRERLPEVMLPAALQLLDALPLTPNGKVDRRALEALPVSPETGGEAADRTAPRTETEELLAGIFAELLAARSVGIEDDFFALGGHSLLATRLLSRVRRVLGVDLELRAVFEARTVAALAVRIEEAQRQGAAAPVPAPHRRSPGTAEEALPLSFAQERLWFLDQLEPGSPAYNVPRRLDLQGNLGAAGRSALTAALGEIVRRHEALRTVFATDDGSPVQRIQPPAPFPLPLVDLAGLPEAAGRDEAERLAVEEARRPFDLAAGPLLRSLLLRRGEAFHHLLLTTHHIVSDGWSAGVMTRELAVLYAAFRERLPSPLPELPLQAADFALWQREHLTGERLASQLDYWRERLAVPPPVLELPADRPRPAAPTGRGAVVGSALSAELAAELARLGRQTGATLFMTLLGTFQALLGRVTGETDVAVGAPVAHRTPAETEGLIGFFVNTVVLRTDLAGDPTFVELLGQVRVTALGAWAHQDVPFERVVEEVRPLRGSVASPLFQTLFVLQRDQPGDLHLGGLRATLREVHTGTAKVDLTLAVQAAASGLVAALEHSTDLFEAATASRLLSHFVHLLEGAAARPEARLSELPLLTETEVHQAVVETNRTRRDYPQETPIHRLFEEQSDRHPERPALVADGEEVSYGELDARANRLARHLLDRGLLPEEPVGVALDRGIGMIVAFLAILKAGGAYVPLDRGYPPARLEAMIEEAGVRRVLRDEQIDAAPEAARPDVPVPARTLAYVMFTSGSTGRPRAVGVEHRSVVRLVRGVDWADLGPEQVFLQIAPASFDAATLEIWAPLLNGGRLVLGPQGAPSIAELGELLARHGVTTLWLTAGLFHQVVESRIEALRGLSQLLAGGDVLAPSAVHRVLAELPGCTLINGYGPTENTTFTCCHTVRSPVPPGGSVPIGRPIANTRVYVLDATLRPVPDGVAGELCAAGDGLARGYLGRPELTAERFVPNPFEEGRLYRTGDRVRRRPVADGWEIDFLGRMDQQVKIRGFRVEPGEVEAALGEHPEVREAVLLARRDEPGELRLVAYVVPAEPTAAPPEAGELRAFLQARLPGHMMPAAYVALAALPLTPNGKVDRRALPAPEGVPAARQTVAPRTPLEERLAEIWQSVLGTGRIGVHDDFFELGGHSLLAVRLLARVEDALGVRLPVREVFDSPTLAEMAERVARAQEQGASAEAPIRPRRDLGGPQPLSFAQERLWFLDRLGAGSAPYSIPSHVRLSGPLDAEVLERTFAELVRRHESLRTTFGERGGVPFQEIALTGDVQMPRFDLVGLPGPARETEMLRLAVEEARRPFDLARGPLLRTALVRLGPEDHVLAATMHHIVSDGWSMTVLIREMAALYEAFSAGLPAPLPEPVLQYADFAVWQRERLCGERLASELAWWSGRLAGLQPLEILTDRPRPPVQSHRGARRRLVLSAATAAGLRALGQREGASLFMVLLALWDVLLYRCSGQSDLAVGSPVAGRERGEVQGLIGFFVNTLVLRTDLAGRPRFRNLLGRVRATALEAFSHGELPFGKLVEHLQPERLRDRNPLVQVLCTLQNQLWPEMRIGPVRLAPLDLETGVAKLDLSLTWSEGERGLEATLEHSTDLFDGATAQRLLRHTMTLIREVLDDPERTIDEIPLLSTAERAEALAAGTGARSGDFPEGGVHALFEEQAALRPEAVAVEFEDACLTYAALDARANQLARALRRLGAGPGAVVGFHVPRSPEMIVSLFGILKSGAAYLPLDFSHPRERLAAMIEDCRPVALLTLAAVRHLLPEDLLPPVLRLDADREVIDRESPAPVSGGSTADDLLFVMYTSGSTGRPKGVMVTHRGLLNRFLRTREFIGLGPSDVMLHKSPMAFDFSVWEALGALTAGGRAVVARPDTHVDFPHLAHLIDERGITIFHFVPTLLEAFLAQEGIAGGGTAVRQVLTGGEALTPALRDRFFARFRVPLDNQYGPTEGSIDVTWHRMLPDGPRPPVTPIGRPHAWCAAHVLGPSLEPLPPGIPGELFLGGVCLARGYLDRPDLTAERFIPDPFADLGGGGRLYRTGDLTRRLPGGDIEYLGRIDHQIKIRGVRIEPGEIEAALLRHPRLRAAAAVIHQGSPERPGKRLVACFAAEEPAPDGRELRALLARTLPETMIPSAFVRLPALPRLASDKIDRGALARMEVSDSDGSVGSVGSPIEELIAGIWSELLGVETVGVDDDFFALGGHSLLAVQAVSRVRDRLGIEVAVRDLFDAPTLAGLARRIESGLRRERTGTEAAVPPLLPVPRDLRLPLSFAQQRLWLLDQLDPGSPVYNVPAAVELTGRLDVAALAAAFREVVLRHEALRTTFRTVDDGPVQVIAEPGGFSLPLIDLQSLPGSTGEESRLAADQARWGFDLATGPLLRATLLRTGAERHVLLLTMHHIVSDGWSVGVLVREIGTLYAAFAAGRPSPLPELAVQYADYAVWQRRHLSGDILEAELAWWRGELAGMPPALDLLPDRPRPAAPSGRGAVYAFAIDRDGSAGLAALSRRHGGTLFMTLLAGFAALLGRLTGQDDLAVGMPVGGRTRVETEPLIGFFVNTLVLRAGLAGDPDMEELLGRVRTRLLAAWVHQEVPFERLVEELAPVRDTGRPPLVQAVLVLQNAPMDPLELPGLALTASRIDTGTAKFELTCTLIETESGLAGTLEYSRDLFERPTVERLAGHLARLLAGAAADPQRRLSELPLLSAEEREQILGEWSGKTTDYPREATIHSLFAEQAALRPDAVAVAGTDTALTYGELRRRADRQACRLRAMGVGPEVRVGLCLDRSPDRVVATLAVLAAGGAYVPLDPSHPPARLAAALRASGAAVLVTEARWLAVLPETAPAVLCIDREELSEPEAVEPPKVPASALAYVMYTSGSTGEPKGVAVPHRAVVRLVRETGYARFGPNEIFLQLAPYAFDASTLELWGALLNGGRVAVPPPGVLAPPELGELLAEHGVTTLWLTAGLFHQMVEDNLPGLAGVRQLLAGGDVLSPAHVRRVVEELPGTRLINGYGPTENTTFTCCHPVEAIPESAVPLGRPIANTRVYVLDRHLAPVPAGVAGELCAGGDGLARGYLDQSEWTAERFVPDPFGGPGERLYRTGDLARFLPGGRIEFLGRIDTQVKIRGFRIEPGEIETALLRHLGVREAAVVARPGRDGLRLVAYVVPANGLAEDTGSLFDELRTHLRQRLPEPMIPSAFLEMQYLPLNANGKLDRAALPEPEPPINGDEYVAPRTPIEELIAGIWAEVLGLERVGVCSDFFALGGHSLLATRVVTRVRQTLGVDLGVRELFEARTVEGMTLAVAAELLGRADTEAIVEAFAAAGSVAVEEAVG